MVIHTTIRLYHSIEATVDVIEMYDNKIHYTEKGVVKWC